MEKIHRGLILHKAAKRNKKSITQIAKDAGVDQSTFYYHKDQEDLPFDILYKYAVAMDYFFSAELPEFTEWLKENRLDVQNEETHLSIENLVKERDYWKDRYYSLLEEHNKLIKEKYLNS
ncbi:hypothetical protein [Sphingobacterium sp. UBA1498]|uniref:hypothetical protein n=1 Tax=Sphingobacterium sp. UBA1498 TaxID=1947481 RepID=UPI0025EE0564|nr:hypothetical protein [Sphingobacterium sp. UBA1498]